MSSMVPRREGGEMVSLRDALDRMFQESFVRPWSSFIGAGGRETMLIDVYDQEDKVVVEAAMPGVKPEDIDIRVQGDVLTIKAETKQEKDVSEDKYTYKERSYGVLQRSVTLPTEVNADQAEAILDNGVLRLSLPKTEEQRPKSIKVKPSEQS
ncbi:MAG: Hsp20/alpha crystallin family protein [Anaerolineae bacterium]